MVMISSDCFVITILFSCLSLSSNNNIVCAVQSINSINTNGANGANTYTNNNVVTINKSSSTSQESVLKQSCIQTNDCTAQNTYCDKIQHKCMCNSDLIAVRSLINRTKIPVSMPICLSAAKLDERCYSQDQCVVTNTVCVFVDPGVGSFGNKSSHFCKCKEGYHQEDREEVIELSGQKIVNRPICGHFVSMGNSWVGTFAIICIMLLIILIGCFIGIIRFQRWKQRPLASTVTSLAATSGHTPHLMSSSPPPMGSVEAEFQNDFIQVFPMHHLEPLPDKNTQHPYVIK